jgi:hypothetical protein
MRSLRRLAREPLVHFLLLGGLLFLFFAWRGGSGRAGSNHIVVTLGQIEHLASGFARTWQRPPTDAELGGLIDDYVKEEIANREAVAMGLDRGDAIVRRRLRQKLEFLVEYDSASSPPTDAELQAWWEAHPELLRTEPQVAFRQVYVSADRRGASTRAEAEELLAALRAGGPEVAIDGMGDPSLLPAEEPLGPLREVKRSFGEEFARKLAEIEPGRWSDPIESAYGLHLVLVRERVAAATPELASIRPLVERELLAERRESEIRAFYERLLEKYAVTIEEQQQASTSQGAPR